MSELNTIETTISRGPSKGRGLMALSIILAVLLIDQILKIWVKTHFYLGESHEIFPWFQIAFIQNNGMAFGWEMGSKLALTLFRIAAIIAGIYYLVRLHQSRREPVGYVVCIALIVAGAIGNVIDCTFYGLIFDNPAPPHLATLFPASGGYAPLLHGQVVDMLYFPLISFDWPSWMPWIGDTRFVFFHPIFNIADAAISTGIIALLLFYHKHLGFSSADGNDAEKNQ